MEFFIQDPNIAKLPPEDVRIQDLKAGLSTDSRRVRVALVLTPFQEPPEIEANLFDAAGQKVGSTSIVEPVNGKLEWTMHIRQVESVTGELSLWVSVAYPGKQETVDQREIHVAMTWIDE